MKSFLKIFLLIVFFTIISYSAFAQTNDEYVSVLIAYRDSWDDSFRFFFSNQNYRLSLNRDLSRSNFHIPLALLCNYMNNNGFTFVQMVYGSGDNDDNLFVLFKKK